MRAGLPICTAAALPHWDSVAHRDVGLARFWGLLAKVTFDQPRSALGPDRESIYISIFKK